MKKEKKKNGKGTNWAQLLKRASVEESWDKNISVSFLSFGNKLLERN